jgi:hypothetical protein
VQKNAWKRSSGRLVVFNFSAVGVVYVFEQGVNLQAFASVAEMEQISESLATNHSSSDNGRDVIDHSALDLLQTLFLMRLRGFKGPIGEFDRTRCMCFMCIIRLSFLLC